MHPERCSPTVRALAAILSLGCFAGALLVAGVLVLVAMNLSFGNPAHLLVGFTGVASVVVLLISAVRLGFHPSAGGMLWALASLVVLWIFIGSFSLSGAGGLLH